MNKIAEYHLIHSLFKFPQFLDCLLTANMVRLQNSVNTLHLVDKSPRFFYTIYVLKKPIHLPCSSSPFVIEMSLLFSIAECIPLLLYLFHIKGPLSYSQFGAMMNKTIIYISI